MFISLVVDGRKGKNGGLVSGALKTAQEHCSLNNCNLQQWEEKSSLNCEPIINRNNAGKPLPPPPPLAHHTH